jgi:hypothetical protein
MSFGNESHTQTIFQELLKCVELDGSGLDLISIYQELRLKHAKEQGIFAMIHDTYQKIVNYRNRLYPEGIVSSTSLLPELGAIVSSYALPTPYFATQHQNVDQI